MTARRSQIGATRRTDTVHAPCMLRCGAESWFRKLASIGPRCAQEGQRRGFKGAAKELQRSSQGASKGPQRGFKGAQRDLKGAAKEQPGGFEGMPIEQQPVAHGCQADGRDTKPVAMALSLSSGPRGSRLDLRGGVPGCPCGVPARRGGVPGCLAEFLDTLRSSWIPCGVSAGRCAGQPGRSWDLSGELNWHVACLPLIQPTYGE